MSQLVVIAIGGNSLIKDPRRQRVEDQYAAICETAQPIVDLIEDGYRTVISHGNGPQVGFILRRSEIAYTHEGLHFVHLASSMADKTPMIFSFGLSASHFRLLMSFLKKSRIDRINNTVPKVYV